MSPNPSAERLRTAGGTASTITIPPVPDPTAGWLRGRDLLHRRGDVPVVPRPVRRRRAATGVDDGVDALRSHNLFGYGLRPRPRPPKPPWAHLLGTRRLHLGHRSKMIYDTCAQAVVCGLSNSFPSGMEAVTYILYRVLSTRCRAVLARSAVLPPYAVKMRRFT